MKPYFEEKGITLYQSDCLEAMRLIPDASIDACVTDPPYGTTACSWDSVIPFAPMWAELKRIVKKNGAIVLFGSQPFTSALVMSNPQMFKYEWVWRKNEATGYANANRQPMRNCEDIAVFCGGAATYNPQGLVPFGQMVRRGTAGGYMGRSALTVGAPSLQEFTKYPRLVLDIDVDPSPIHPTQKPIELMRYLVRTYTNEGDTVLDFTCGSGTTGVACVIERRQFIGIEQDAHYCEVSAARIKRAQGVACDIPKRIKQYAPTPLFEAVA